jgi:hypothetical protein
MTAPLTGKPPKGYVRREKGVVYIKRIKDAKREDIVEAPAKEYGWPLMRRVMEMQLDLAGGSDENR